jgi:hypothetical protein
MMLNNFRAKTLLNEQLSLIFLRSSQNSFLNENKLANLDQDSDLQVIFGNFSSRAFNIWTLIQYLTSHWGNKQEIRKKFLIIPCDWKAEISARRIKRNSRFETDASGARERRPKEKIRWIQDDSQKIKHAVESFDSV